MTKESENLFYKASAVVSAIIKKAKEGGRFPANGRLKGVSSVELLCVCREGLEGIVTAHNEHLKKKATASKPYQPFVSRKLLTLSYVTCYKYVHNK